MRTEKECNSAHRFLFTDELLSDEQIGYVKEDVIKRYNNEVKDKYYKKFINWQRKKNEIVLYTLYAYADLKLPKTFDCLFNLNNPKEYSDCKFKLTQSLYEGSYPVESIEDGHKHICVFEFDNKIPDILNKLHIAKGKNYELPKNAFMIGICNSVDYISIRKYRENYLMLREKYGNSWWKYDKSE